MMDYMRQLNRFFEFSEADCLPASAQIVYLHLLNINNRLHWREWFKVANSRLEKLTGLGSNNSVINAKNRLKQAGLIDFESGKRSVTKYHIFAIGAQDGAQDTAQDGAQDGAQDTAQDGAQDTAQDGAHVIRHRHRQDKTETNKYIVEQAVSYLNEKAGTSYKPTTGKTVSLVNARLKEGFTLDDIKTVVNSKVAEWAHDANMAKYLRPETLFGTKFESYLNAATMGGVKEDGRNTRGNRGDNEAQARANEFREACRRADAAQVYPWEVQSSASGD